MIVEICANSIESVLIANKANADRIELCSGLNIGGLTPSTGLIELAVEKSKIPIHCLIRPREGHFIYDKYDFKTIIADITKMQSLGVSGIVIGVMTKEYKVNIKQLDEIIRVSKNLEVTYHRAFDSLKDPEKELKILSSIGVSRILSSGGADSAIKGINRLIRWNSISSKSIEIQPGGGINISNVLKFKEAGFKSIHLSGSSSQKWNNLIPNNINETFFNQKFKKPNIKKINNIISLIKNKNSS
mgnify:FL=1